MSIQTILSAVSFETRSFKRSGILQVSTGANAAARYVQFRAGRSGLRVSCRRVQVWGYLRTPKSLRGSPVALALRGE